MILFIQKGLSFGLSRMMLPAAAGLASLLLGAGALAQTHPLADTGQVICYNDTGSTGTVSAGNPNPVQAGFEGQDCVRGAAAADAVDAMYKLGGSSRRGADYTKIANDGSELPANAALGSGPGDWACTRDNVTGLTWELKVNDENHLRHRNHTYTCYDTNASVNGGNAGTVGTDTTCNSTLTNCNTTAFRDAINAADLYGANDWRLPMSCFSWLAGTYPLLLFSTRLGPHVAETSQLICTSRCTESICDTMTYFSVRHTNLEINGHEGRYCKCQRSDMHADSNA